MKHLSHAAQDPLGTAPKEWEGFHLSETGGHRATALLFLPMPAVAHRQSLALRPALQARSPRSYWEQPCLGAGSKCSNGLVRVSAIQMQTGADSSALRGWEE